MADILNRVLKILLFLLFCNQIIASARHELVEDDEYADTLSDILADENAIFPADKSRRSFQNKRSVGELPEAKVPGTAYTLEDAEKRKKSAGVSYHLPTAEVPPALAVTVPVPTPAPQTTPTFETSNVCVPNPCQNGGTCGKDNKGEFQCACPLNYRGSFCHQVMLKCHVIGCDSVTDCIAAPSGAICVCKLGSMGRLCQMEIAEPSEWEKVKLVISERTIYTGEIVGGVTLGISVLLSILFCIHCHRVNTRRAIVRKRYKDILDKGIVPSEPPPDWCEISGDLIKQTLCCNKGSSLTGDYTPRSTTVSQSLSRTQALNKQKEDELLRLLNTQTDIPEYNFDFPERIDQEINRRASLRRGLGIDNSHINNKFDINRNPVPFHTGTRMHASTTSLKQPFKLSTKTSIDARSRSRNPPPPIQKRYSLQDELLKQGSQQNQQNPFNRQYTRSLTHLHNTGGNQIYSDTNDLKHKDFAYEHEVHDNDFHDDFIPQPSDRYRNNSASQPYTSNKSQFENARTVGYQMETEKENRRKRMKRENIVEKKMSDITDNLKKLKKSLSDRKSARRNDSSSYVKTLQGSRTRKLRTGDVRYAMRNNFEKYITEASSDENSVLDEKLLIRINAENKRPDDIYRCHPNTSKNGNENANNDSISSNDSDYLRMYQRNLKYHQQNMRCISKNTSPPKRLKNKESQLQCVSVEDCITYGHLTDPSIQHDNLETTCWSWDHEPGVYCTDKYKGNMRKFRPEGRHANIQTTESDFIREKHSDGRCSRTFPYRRQSTHDGQSNIATPVIDVSIGPVTTQPRKQSDTNTFNYASTETESPKENTGSEFYGVQSQNAQLSSSDKNTDVEKRASLQNVDLNKPFDKDISTDRLYVRSFDSDDQKLYYVSNDLASRIIYECQTRPDMNQESLVTPEKRVIEHQDMSSQHYNCSTPTLFHNRNEERPPVYKRDTPSIVTDTENTIIISTDFQDGDTLIAESNASDTEVEL